MDEKESIANKSNAKLIIISLRSTDDELKSDMHWTVTLFTCFIALCILYGFYAFFGWVWLTALLSIGEDLLWGFFGVFLACGIGMGAAVAFSMKAQKIGFWEALSENDARRERDPRGKCCGFQIY